MSRAHKKGRLDIGALSPKSAPTVVKHFRPAELHFSQPTRFCNAAMPSNSLQSEQLWGREPARPGADQHAQYRSRGTRC